MSDKYIFNVSSLFILVKIAEIQSAGLSSLNLDDPGAFLEKILFSCGSSKEQIIKLLAIAKDVKEDDIKNMDALEFLEEFNKFKNSVDWSKVMGELKSLLPKAAREVVETLLTPVNTNEASTAQ